MKRTALERAGYSFFQNWCMEYGIWNRFWIWGLCKGGLSYGVVFGVGFLPAEKKILSSLWNTDESALCIYGYFAEFFLEIFTSHLQQFDVISQWDYLFLQFCDIIILEIEPKHAGYCVCGIGKLSGINRITYFLFNVRGEFYWQLFFSDSGIWRHWEYLCFWGIIVQVCWKNFVWNSFLAISLRV